MQTRRFGTSWVITTDPKWVRDAMPGGISSQSMANMVEAFQCWTGAGWGNQLIGAKLFDDEKAAAAYMTQHKCTMLGA